MHIEAIVRNSVIRFMTAASPKVSSNCVYLGLLYSAAHPARLDDRATEDALLGITIKVERPLPDAT